LWLLILPNLVGDAFTLLRRQFLLTSRRSTRRRPGGRRIRAADHAEGDRADGERIAATSMFMFFFTWRHFGPLLYTSDEPSN
jgi:hypothetical protein